MIPKTNLGARRKLLLLFSVFTLSVPFLLVNKKVSEICKSIERVFIVDQRNIGIAL